MDVWWRGERHTRGATHYVKGGSAELSDAAGAVQGFIWGVNSFDQWGVELGKSLASGVRGRLSAARRDGQLDSKGVNAGTKSLMQHYLTGHSRR